MLKINSKTKIVLMGKDDILPRISGGLTVRYAQKEYEVIGYHDYPDRLYLQDPSDSECELIVKMDKVKPLLRKMDSMTSEEKDYYQSLINDATNHVIGIWEVTEWLNQRMFDYKDLIGQGLAEEI